MAILKYLQKAILKLHAQVIDIVCALFICFKFQVSSFICHIHDYTEIV